MKVEVTNGEGLKRHVSVTVPGETMKAEIDKRLKELGKDAQIDGFRKGKVPLNRLRDQFGDKVKMDAVDELFRQSIGKAVDDNKLKIASRPTVTALDLADDMTLTYEADLEVFPEVSQVVFDNLNLPSANMEVDDSEIDEIIGQIRQQFSELRSLNRPTEKDDIVVIDMVKVNDPHNTLEEDEFPDSTIDLSSAATLPEFKEHLPGLKADDQKEIKVTYDKDYSDPAFAGAQITYACKVKSVNERVLPEINDTLAKRAGMGETALELRIEIRKRLEQQKDVEQKKAQRRLLVDLVCAKNDLAIPDGPISEYLDNLVKDFKERGEEFDEEAIRKQYRPIGIKSMQWDILWRSLADQEKIEVLAEDTENWIKGFAAYHKITTEQATESLRQGGKIQELRDSIHEEKVLNFLTEKATLVPLKK